MSERSASVTQDDTENGLTGAEVAERVADGRTNAAGTHTSRSTAQIIRANVVTPFNGLLLTLFIVILTTGRWQNGLFGLVIVANTAIGVFQELRAKRTLDRLAVLNAPHARVVRDGATAEVEVTEVVADDLVEIRTGDQVVADGTITATTGLEIDESLLTGETDPIPKTTGDEVRSGSIVVAGTGRFRATHVGADAYATRLTAEARRFTVVRSELVAGTNKLLRWISLMMLVIAPLLLWSQFRTSDTDDWQEAVTGTVAGLVGMVPEGLVLLTSLAFMIAAVSLAREQTLVQELPAVEVLARVDTVCLDKTGTLTHGDIVFDRLVVDPADDADAREALALCATAPDANATSTALAAEFTDPTWRRTGGIPFSSARKWSAVSAEGHGTWVLGAPEMVFPDSTDQPLPAQAADIAGEGKRVLVLASTAEPATDTELPADLTARALVVLAERIRDDAADTLRFFTGQGVTLKVISGDNPRTVGAVAVAVGMPGITDATEAVDARTLPDDPDELADVLEHTAVLGRVTPHQKRAIVGALQRRGHVVAMTGDGVNDAMALKDADIGVAMGNGAAATRAVAQLVLLDSRFAHLPDVVAEGRRVIANIERAANLFLVKNVYSLVLALVVVATSLAYPLAPIQLTMISAATIGIPGFVLALAPNRRRYVPGFLRRVLRLAVPTGAVIGLAAYAGDLTIRGLESDGGRPAGQTVATVVVVIASLWTLSLLARPLTRWKLALIIGLAGAVATILAVPALGSGVFLLAVTPQRLVVGAVIGVVAGILVELIGRAILRPVHDASGEA
ncbi:cation-transporting ATPase E [Saccharothrix tamanrassetensis]|uniref:Cation-transporting ATPase E n=1 Tax=Saccharothrix tamanrassetensis TaxID=1051531 RepID=A0A841CLY7_9PSEU|nr:HAD-IC family P-type ATPase [Saccharothrix tamanrassetensis]MBB5957953.1 cation-transporting ATPase E [Saccharothrix tamanrassetensis]